MSETDAPGPTPPDVSRPEASARPAPAPARVRVTAPRPGEASVSREPATTTDPTDIQAVYVRSLIRSQLRLALLCALAFSAAVVVFVVAIVFTPVLEQTFVAGVPVSWLLLGVGVYPLALAVAVLYVRGATRNESRYRSLAEDA